jgi:hypothetical protein
MYVPRSSAGASSWFSCVRTVRISSNSVFQVELVLLDVAEEHLAVEVVTGLVRHFDEQVRHLEFRLDDAAQDARRHQEGRGVRGLNGLFEFFQFQGDSPTMPHCEGRDRANLP